MQHIHQHVRLNTMAALIAASFSVPALAQEIELLPEITIYADREEKPLNKSTQSLTVVNGSTIEKTQAKNIRDLQNVDPNISVRRNAARFTAALSGSGRDQNSGFNIRGLEGGRVLSVVDGVRLPSPFSFTTVNYGNGDYVDLSSLKALEVVRGAASTLHGSDGLAGAVSYTTLDPKDLLDIFGKNSYASLNAGYASEDDSWRTVGRAALRSGNTELLAIGSLSKGHEVKNKGGIGGVGSLRTEANPQDYTQYNVLLKGVVHASPNNQLDVAYEHYRKTTKADLLTSLSNTVTDSKAKDKIERDRISISQKYTAQLPWLSQLNWKLSYQETKQRQYTEENRTIGNRSRDNAFKEQSVNLNSTAISKFVTGQTDHSIVWGLDYLYSKSSSFRTGTNYSPAGAVLSTSFSDPIFPDTTYNLGGLFAQDTISLLKDANGQAKLEITPGLRFDWFSLKPKDTHGTTGYNYEHKKLSDNHVSPRIGMLYRITPVLSVVANYAHGFKAPEAGQVNSSFQNITPYYSYATIGNPSLKPETSRTAELSLRFEQAKWSASLTGYHGKYKNFIEQTIIKGNGSAANPVLYQYVNLGKVKLSGFEGSGVYRFNENWGAAAGFAYNKGHDITNGTKTPLNTINPLRINLGLSWDASSKQYGTQVLVNYNAKKKQSDIDAAALGLSAGAEPFASKAFTTVDLNAYWQVSKNFKLNLAINNLTGKKHWRWSDVRGQASNSPTLDAYSSAGRNVSIGITGQF